MKKNNPLRFFSYINKKKTNPFKSYNFIVELFPLE